MSIPHFLKYQPDFRASFTGLSRSGSARLAAGVTCLCFFTSWVLPYHTYPYWSFYHDYISLIGVLCAFFVVLNEGQGVAGRTIALPRTVLLPVLLAGSVVLDAVLGRMTAAGDAVIAVGYLLAAAAAMTVGHAVVSAASSDVDRERPYRYLTTVLLAAGLLSAIATLTQYLRVDDRLGDLTAAIALDGTGVIRPSANLGQPNQLALMLCWALGALWYVYQRGRLKPWMAFVAAITLLASLALTQSKIGWLIVPALAVVTAWASRRPIGFKRVPPIVVTALVLFSAAIVLTLPILSQALGTTTQDVGQRLESNGVRLVMILQGLHIGLQHPFFGIGWNGFGAGQLEVAAGFSTSQYAMHAHNFVANLAAERGWLVTLAVVAAIAYWCWTRLVRRAASMETVFATMLFAALAIHSMVEFPLWYAYVLMPTALVVGLIEGSALRKSPVFQASRLGLVAAALLSTVVLVGIANDYRHLVQSFRAFTFSRIGWTYADGTTEEPAWTAFPHFYAYMRFFSVRPQTEMSAEQITAGEAVMRRFGYEPVLMRMATIYALNHRENDALNTMDVLRHLYFNRYPLAYSEWSVMATEFPSVLGKVYARLPPP